MTLEDRWKYDAYVLEYTARYKGLVLVTPTNLLDEYDNYMKILAEGDIDELASAFCSCYQSEFKSEIECKDIALLSKTFRYKIDFPSLVSLTGNYKWVDAVIKAIDNRALARYELSEGNPLLESLFDVGLSVDTIACIKTVIEAESWWS